MYQGRDEASSGGCALGPLSDVFGLVSSIGGYFIGQWLTGDPVAGMIGGLFAIPLVIYAARQSALSWLLAGVGILVGFGAEIAVWLYGAVPAGEAGPSALNPYVAGTGTGLTGGALAGYMIGRLWPQLEIRGWRLINKMSRINVPMNLLSDKEDGDTS